MSESLQSFFLTESSTGYTCRKLSLSEVITCFYYFLKRKSLQLTVSLEVNIWDAVWLSSIQLWSVAVEIIVENSSRIQEKQAYTL